jgi:hypothetical protein
MHGSMNIKFTELCFEYWVIDGIYQIKLGMVLKLK